MDGKPDSELTGNLRVPQGLKHEIKVAAVTRKMREYRLVEEMWKLWKEAHEGKGPAGLTAPAHFHRTQEEDELCQAVMDFWRDPVARQEDPGGIGAAVLDSFVKRFLRKRAGGGEL